MNEPIQQPKKKQNKTLLYVLGGCLIISICVACAAVLGFGGLAYYFYLEEASAIPPIEVVEATAVPTKPRRASQK